MNKTFLLGFLAALAAAGTASAQEPRVARIAIVDMARVSAESQLGKGYAAQIEKLQTDFQNTVTQNSTAVQKLETEIRTLQDELEKQGAVLSPEARDKKQQEITRKLRERQATAEDGQAEINRVRDRATQQAQSIQNEFQVKVRPLVEQVAKEKGYDMVFDAAVTFPINHEFDITPLVIAKADDLAKTEKPAAAPAAAAKPPVAPKPRP